MDVEKLLDQNKQPYFTYRLLGKQNLRVVFKGNPYRTCVNEIRLALQAMVFHF